MFGIFILIRRSDVFVLRCNTPAITINEGREIRGPEVSWTKCLPFCGHSVVWVNREKPCTAVKYFLSGMPQLRTLTAILGS